MASRVETLLKTAVLSTALLISANSKSIAQMAMPEPDDPNNVSKNAPARVYSGNQEGLYGAPIKYEKIRHDPRTTVDTANIHKFFGDKFKDARVIQLGPEDKNEQLAIISLKPDTLNATTTRERTILYAFDKDGNGLQQVGQRDLYAENGRPSFSVDYANTPFVKGSQKITIKKEQLAGEFYDGTQSTYSTDYYIENTVNALEAGNFSEARKIFDQSQAAKSYSHELSQFERSNKYTKAATLRASKPAVAFFAEESARMIEKTKDRNTVIAASKQDVVKP